MEIIRAVEIHGIDIVRRHELLQIGHLRAFDIERLQLCYQMPAEHGRLMLPSASAACAASHNPLSARRRLIVVWLRPVCAATSSSDAPLWISLVSAAASSSG